MLMREMAVNIFQHDDAGIHDDAEINRSDRQQVRRFAAQHRDDDGEEQCDGNGPRYDQGATQIAQEYPLDEKDQGNAEEHVVQHGPHRNGNEVTAVVERLDLQAGGQAAVGIHALDGCAYARHYLHRALEFLHQHNAGDDVSLVVAARNTEPGREPDLNLSNIGKQHGHTALLGQNDIADVFKRPNDADATDVDRLLAHCDRAAAYIGVAAGDGSDDLRNRKTERHHPVEVDLRLKLLGFAAENQNV